MTTQSTTLKAIANGQTTPEPVDPYQRLKGQLERSKNEFIPLFGGSMQNVEKFIRVVLNSVMATPDLLEADRRSLITACMKAAQDGLLPDGREAVLNIYNTNVARRNAPPDWRKMVQYLPMVGGLVKKLYASGEVTNIDAAAVYEHDKFLFRRGDAPKLDHEPTMADDAGRIIASYVVITLKSGEIKREVMPRRDIEAVRSASKSPDGANSPWVKWYDQQAIKSVIKRAYKQLPKSDAFEAVEKSDNTEMGFAATPSSVGEIVARHALENSPSGSLDIGPIVAPDAEPAYQPEDAAEPAANVRHAAPAATYKQVIDNMLKAKTLEALDDAATLIGAVQDPAQRTELTQKYEALRDERAA